jgi:hypothetical protein
MTCITTWEEIFLTYWTVTHILANLAVMSSEDLLVNAHSTILAVTKVLAPADTTETTVGTVVGTFLVGHPQVANGTVILAKLDMTVDAFITKI